MYLTRTLPVTFSDRRRAQVRLENYLYGFNGQLKDDEVYGEGNAYAFEYRIHDARLGRFLSVDPLALEYPYYTPYSFAGNRVIDCIDLEGLEPFPYMQKGEYLPNSSPGNVSQNITTFLFNSVIVDTYNTSSGVLNFSEGILSGKYGTGAEIASNIYCGIGDASENAYEYHTKTPVELQFADFGDALGKSLSKVENWEMASNVILTAGAFKSVGGKSPTKVTTTAEVVSIPKMGIKDVGNFLESANAEWGQGLSNAGRGLQKHAGRAGSAFEDVTFSHKSANMDALKIMDEIYNSPNRAIQPAENGGFHVFDSNSRKGFAVSREGLFNGFRELKNKNP